MKFTGLGIELAGITLFFLAIGLAFDSYMENEHGIATALSTVMGFTLAMIRFLVKALPPRS